VLAERVEREAIHSITHDLSSGAKKLLGVLAALQLDIGTDELRSVLGTTPPELMTVWSEVELAGLARRDALMSEAVHIDLRPSIREILSKPASVDRDLASWFATFVDNVDRVSAAIDHYLLAEAYEEAAELLRGRGELLIRTGHADAALDFASRIPSEKLAGALHVSVVMVIARALSGLGRAPEALSTLRTWLFETTYSPDAASAYRLEIARQLYLVGEFDECDREALAVIGLPDATPRTVGSAWSLIGRVLFARRELDQAQSAYQRAMDIFGAAGDHFGINKVRYRMGLIELKRGDLNSAQGTMTRVLVESRRLQDRKRESYALHRLGLISARRGDTADAERLFHESIALKRGAGNVRGVVFTQHELASLALRQGDVDVAWDFGQKAFRKAEECSLRKEAGMTATLLAIIALRRGRTSEAEYWLAIAVETFERVGLHQRACEARQRYEAAILDAPAQ
jgi:tetratricopeptide (TPR) repeat protein